MTDVVFVAIIGAMQAVSVAYLRQTVKKSSCGNAACVRSISRALKDLRDPGGDLPAAAGKKATTGPRFAGSI